MINFRNVLAVLFLTVSMQISLANSPKELFKELEPYKTEMLAVSPLHNLYFEQSGNKKGEPVLVIHGGPGVGASIKFRRLFDPKHFRIIIADQRANKRSKPLGSLKENQTNLLVEDYEKLRKHLGIKQWHVLGGSWGTTLAILYAEKNPAVVKSLTFRGVFTAQKDELDHYFSQAMRKKYPAEWNTFLKTLGVEEKYKKNKNLNFTDLLNTLVQSSVVEDQTKATKALVYWDDTLSGKGGDLEFVPEETDIMGTRVYFHYEKNLYFLQNNDVLNAAQKIPNTIPVNIVQGEKDDLCPSWAAKRLHAAIKHSKLHLIANGKHSNFDPPVQAKVMELFESLKVKN